MCGHPYWDHINIAYTFLLIFFIYLFLSVCAICWLSLYGEPSSNLNSYIIVIVKLKKKKEEEDGKQRLR